MGFNQYFLTHRRTPSTWAATVGAMKEHGTRVKGLCQCCDFRADPLDLDKIIAVKGAEFSLFDVLGVCPDCGAGVRFFFSPGAGTPFRPCVT